MTMTDISNLNIEGYKYKIEQHKSSKPYPELALNTIGKLDFSFKKSYQI